MPPLQRVSSTFCRKPESSRAASGQLGRTLFELMSGGDRRVIACSEVDGHVAVVMSSATRWEAGLSLMQASAQPRASLL